MGSKQKQLSMIHLGFSTISEDSNLVVLNGQKEIPWSSNITNSVSNVSAQLLDSGNLTLNDSRNGIKLWESFQEPTDTLLTNMKLSANVRTGEKVQLTSWRSPSDPSIGSFSGGLDLSNIPQFFIWKKNRPYWRTGPWNGRIFIGVQGMASVYLDGFKFGDDDQEGSSYLTFSCANHPLSYFILNSQGKLVEAIQVDGKKNWTTGTFPKIECDIYGMCGEFGSCNYKKNQFAAV